MRGKVVKKLSSHLYDLDDNLSKHPIVNIITFSLLGFLIAIPFLFLVYPAIIVFEQLTDKHWPLILALFSVSVSVAISCALILYSSTLRIAYQIGLIAYLTYLLFSGTKDTQGLYFATLASSAIPVVGSIIVFLTLGLRR